VFQDITIGEFKQLHDGAQQDSHFVDSVGAVKGLEAESKRWSDLRLPGISLLEIGPGSGHVLAAADKAGLSVAGVETSDINRAFIRNTWGIHSLYPDISAVPKDLSFDAIVSINVLEHVYDVTGLLRSIGKLLAPDGVLFVSTVNAASLEAAVLRNWWSMCKQSDHVSFPSPEGMARAAEAIGLQKQRIWSAELPFEFPVSALVAARDWNRERRSSSHGASNGHPAKEPVEGSDLAAKKRLARLYAVGERFDPTSRLLGSLGRAATVKARLGLGERAKAAT
jgi:2-polyprenyl-3-methyl-5-hydroxy-6-metoxy-1,4-benzoquinol methylase